MAPPRKTYVVYFIPRSGSTWLTDLVAGTNALGRPGEMFAHDRAVRFEGMSIDERVAFVMARNQRGGVFGAEIAWAHVTKTFGGVPTLMRFFRDVPCVFLIREDIVLQAISSVRKRRTQVAHSNQTDADGLAKADGAFSYDGDAIRRLVAQHSRFEQHFETMFADQGLEPLRLSYERNMASPQGVLNALAAHIDEPAPGHAPETEVQQLRTEKSYGFAERFRTENAAFIAEVERARAPLLGRLATY